MNQQISSLGLLNFHGNTNCFFAFISDTVFFEAQKGTCNTTPSSTLHQEHLEMVHQAKNVAVR